MGPGRKTCITKAVVKGLKHGDEFAQWVYKSAQKNFYVVTKTFDTGRRFLRVHECSCSIDRNAAELQE